MKKKIFYGICVMILAACTERAADEITVISREDGSGTRSSFIELFGIAEKDAHGKLVDYTVDTADITNSTAVVITSVADNKRAVGYISLGALSSTVRALAIDGAMPSEDTILDGSYQISRPFNIVVRQELSPAAQDFITFILSPTGQAVVRETGYVPVEESEPPYAGTFAAGRVVVAGSSSVTPLMEKLKEAYMTYNTNAAIEIQQSDSTMGINNTISGIAEIGMASRELNASERTQGLRSIVIAFDGIAIIVNTENPVEELSREQVRAIYKGDVTAWQELR
ncbi:MAG: substrate-binding domain-containing protein [Spirochaetaceae bacterium]|nr:substrate-binding domain-containing protein [Spirochaetaceae bacterium]